MTTRGVVLTAALLLPACAGVLRGSSGGLLDRADGKLGTADYPGAAALYDQFLRDNPEDPEAARVRATRAALDRLLLAQTEVERLRRQQAADRAELERLRAETARLRADLERLRSIDLRRTPAPR